jgi:hypothetical protein
LGAAQKMRRQFYVQNAPQAICHSVLP